MNYYDEFFKFPIVLADGRVEQQKAELNPLEVQDVDIIIGEGEARFDDPVIYIEDGWKPTQDSFDNAKKGVFNICEVGFKNAGAFIVASNKEKFKRLHSKFVNQIIEEKTKLQQQQAPQIVYLLVDKDKIQKNDNETDTTEEKS